MSKFYRKLWKDTVVGNKWCRNNRLRCVLACYECCEVFHHFNCPDNTGSGSGASPVRANAAKHPGNYASKSIGGAFVGLNSYSPFWKTLKYIGVRERKLQRKLSDDAVVGGRLYWRFRLCYTLTCSEISSLSITVSTLTGEVIQY